MSSKHREEVINVKLADVLSARGLDADAETIHAKGRPDVLITVNGVKIAIEGRKASQTQSLQKDAKKRIESGISDISLSVEYPDSLYHVTSAKLSGVLDDHLFTGCIFHFSSQGIVENHFSEKTAEELGILIRNAFYLIVRDDVVRSQVSLVQEAIDRAVARAASSNLFFKSDIVRKKLKAALAIDTE